MSTFIWIDHSEKQRRQILALIDRLADSPDPAGTIGIPG